MKRKTVSTLFKILVSILFIYFVYSQIPFREVVKYYQNISIGYILLAILAFVLSQLVSANRLLLYFQRYNYHLPASKNYKLYAIGMFYNFFIPGGIGGDAYKVYFLNKKYKWKVKHLSLAIFMDRFTGLVAILVIICVLLSLLSTLPMYIRLSMPILVVLGLLLSYIIYKKWANKFTPIWAKSLLYSFVVQGLQMLSIVFIILSLHIHSYFLEYLLMFLSSSILGLISFGGIGVREYVFMQSSKYLHIDSEISVAIGLMFTLVTAFVSLFGLYYIWFERKHFPEYKEEIEN